LVRYQLEKRDGHWRLQFDFDNAASELLISTSESRSFRETQVSRDCAGIGG